MARDGLRRIGASALAIGGLTATAALGAFGAGAQDTEAEFFTEADFEVDIDTSDVPLGAPDTGPNFVFVDKDNDGMFNGSDTKIDLPKKGGSLVHEHPTYGLVIPTGVKKLNLADVYVETGGNVVIGQNVKLSVDYGITVYADALDIGPGAKLREGTKEDGYVDGGGIVMDGVQRVTVGSKALLQTPADLEIAGSTQSFVIGEKASFVSMWRDPDDRKSTYGYINADPEVEFVIGAGTKFISGDTIDMGVGFAGEATANTTMTVGEGVKWAAPASVGLFTYGQGEITYPKNAQVTSAQVRLVLPDGANLYLDGAKVKSADFSIESRVFLQIASSKVSIAPQGTMTVDGYDAGTHPDIVEVFGIATVKVAAGGAVEVTATETSIPIGAIKLGKGATLTVND